MRAKTELIREFLVFTAVCIVEKIILLVKNVVRVSIIWNVYFWRFLTFVSNSQMNEIQKRSCNNNGPASFLEV